MKNNELELKDKTGRKSFFYIYCNGVKIGAIKKYQGKYILYPELPEYEAVILIKTTEECLSLMEQYLNEFIDKVTKKS